MAALALVLLAEFALADLSILESFASIEEAKEAIYNVEMLRQDPRSIYRSTKCTDQSYQISIDNLNLSLVTNVSSLMCSQKHYEKKKHFHWHLIVCKFLPGACPQALKVNFGTIILTAVIPKRWRRAV